MYSFFSVVEQNGSDGKSSAKQDSLSEKGVNSSLCGALKQVRRTKITNEKHLVCQVK